MILQAGMFMGVIGLFALIVIIVGSIPLTFKLHPKIFRKDRAFTESTTETKILNALEFIGLYIIVTAILATVLYLFFSGNVVKNGWWFINF